MIWLSGSNRDSVRKQQITFEAKEADLECQQETMDLIPIDQASLKILLGIEICQS